MSYRIEGSQCVHTLVYRRGRPALARRRLYSGCCGRSVVGPRGSRLGRSVWRSTGGGRRRVRTLGIQWVPLCVYTCIVRGEWQEFFYIELKLPFFSSLGKGHSTCKRSSGFVTWGRSSFESEVTSHDSRACIGRFLSIILGTFVER